MRKTFAVGLAVMVDDYGHLGKRNATKAAYSLQTSKIILAQGALASTSATAVERAVRVVISGKVQRVGYRNWAVRLAMGLKIRGWVENAPNGTVHALFGGSDAAVAEMLAACRKGPRRARVRDVAVELVEANDVSSDFGRRN